MIHVFALRKHRSF